MCPTDSPYTPSASQPPRIQETTRRQDTATPPSVFRALRACSASAKATHPTLAVLACSVRTLLHPSPLSFPPSPGACSPLSPVLSAHHAPRRAHQRRPSPRRPLPISSFPAVSAQPHLRPSPAFPCLLLSARLFSRLTSSYNIVSRQIKSYRNISLARIDAPCSKHGYLLTRVRAVLYHSQSTVCVIERLRNRVCPRCNA